jgi:hypothetical protein
MPKSNLPANVTYHDVRKLIFKIAHSMSEKYSIPYTDVLGQAHEIFVEVYNDWQLEAGESQHDSLFSSWLYNKLVWGLTDWLKFEYRERDYLEINEEIVGSYLPHGNLELKELIAGLSDEAKLIAMAVCKTPKELQMMIKWNRADGKREIKATFTEFFVELGWTVDEIHKGFDDLRLALSIPRHEYKEPKVREKEKALRRCRLKRGHVVLLTMKYRTA